MITTRSALLERKTRDAIVTDPARAWVVSRLCLAGMSEQEIADALNCSLRIVGNLLVYAAPWVPRVTASVALKRNRRPEAVPTPRSASVLLRYRPPCTDRGIAGERERRAHYLSSEIRHCVASCELSNAERQKLIERAGMLLADSPVKADGEFSFDKNRLLAEIRSIWLPSGLIAAGRNPETMLSCWLASWIRFWITQPMVWNRALDLAYDHFGVDAQAA